MRPLKEETMTGSDGGGAPLVIFIHVPKTGGITLRDIIGRQYAPDQVYGSPNFLRDSARLWSCDQVRLDGVASQVRVIEGHMPFSLHPYLRRPVTYITLLRDPIE